MINFIKNIVFIIILSISFGHAYSQDTLNIAPQSSISVFASLDISASKLKNNFGIITGVKAGTIIDKSLVIDFGFNSLISRNIKASFVDTVTNIKPTLEFTTLGAEIAYIGNPDDNLFYTAQFGFGTGQIKYNLIYSNSKAINDYYPYYQKDWFYYIEPSINFTYKANFWFRTSLNVSYRLAFDCDYQVKSDRYKSPDISTVQYKLSFLFGDFE